MSLNEVDRVKWGRGRDLFDGETPSQAANAVWTDAVGFIQELLAGTLETDVVDVRVRIAPERVEAVVETVRPPDGIIEIWDTGGTPPNV